MIAFDSLNMKNRDQLASTDALLPQVQVVFRQGAKAHMSLSHWQGIMQRSRASARRFELISLSQRIIQLGREEFGRRKRWNQPFEQRLIDILACSL